jgi:hypothetical protein
MNYRTHPVLVNGRTHHVAVPPSAHTVHKGVHFTLLEWKNIDTAETFDVFLVTPPRYRVHFNYSADSSRSMQMQVYNNTLVTGGTAKQARNRNLEIGGGAVDIILDGTLDTVGDLIADITWGHIGGPSVNSPSSGGADESNPFLLPENYVLRFRFTSKEDTNNLVVRMNFIMEQMIPQE